MDEVGLGKQLQLERQKAGLTQQELCQKAQLSYSTLAKIERGAIKAPSIFTIQSVADVLGLSLDALLGRNVFPTPLPKKISKTGIRFVYFDVNGCLVRFFHRAFTRLAEETDAPADIIESTFWHYNDAVCRGEMSLETFNQRLAAALNVPEVDWMHYYMEEVDPIQEMHELLGWAEQHYHIGLLTNIMPGFIDEMIARKLIPDLNYAAIIDSSKVGSIKPEEAIFDAAEAQSNCQENEILLVDDSRSNIMAAEKHGWRVLWFDDYRPAESIERIKSALAYDE